MLNHLKRCAITVRRRGARLGLFLTAWVLSYVVTAEDQWTRARASGDCGSESVEKAVLVAIGLAVAIGLGFAIRAAVQTYQGQIK
ncbi:Putative membrane protein [Amycolatopsis japonica]|uniref:Putative membrane protein n=1 Tax=Amycolatopsis japonica TaxID=208439 RepID=A0A075UPQ7_9PSEU|nr:hypothetical protein [Amycolatopsis japonica]AIG74386.1 Putative membrane protein [Amycolatopsis japonica]